MNKLLTIVGPTATGKTDIAIGLAKKLNADIVSCDSRQVYKGLDIGTGKLPGGKTKYTKHENYWLIDGVKVWMLDVVGPEKRFDIKDYIIRSREVIGKLFKEGKKVIVVGGTGYYLKGLLEGIENISIENNPETLAQLEQMDLAEIQKKLINDFPEKWKELNYSERQNKRRLVRMLQILTGKKINRGDETGVFDVTVLKIGINASTEMVNLLIDQRVKRRIKEGMIEEAKKLHKNGLSFKRMDDLGLEYRYLAKLLKGEITEKEFEEALCIKIHQYAKRQRTWFRRDKDIIWFDINSKNYRTKLEYLVIDWYNQDNE